MKQKSQTKTEEKQPEAERQEITKYNIGSIVIVKGEKEVGVVTQYKTIHEKETYEYIVYDVHGGWSCCRVHDELEKIGDVK